MIERAKFFGAVRSSLFAGRLAQPQVTGIDAILDAWEARRAEGDPRWPAYILATVHHETGRTMQPVRETFAASDAEALARLDAAFARGALKWVKTPYWRPDAAGRSWLGRGYVQLTHEPNYRAMSALTGYDLVADPGLAMRQDIALTILIEGMAAGSFTGAKLADYCTAARTDWRGARRIINGLESADTVARYASAYADALERASI